MNRLPPSYDPSDDADERYRRASALDPSRPSEAVRRSVLAHAARLAGERAVIAAAPAAAAPRVAPNRLPRRALIFGALAAAALAGLMILPRWRSPPAQSAAEVHLLPATAPPHMDLPAAAPPPAAAPTPAPFPRTTVVQSHSTRGRSASSVAEQAPESAAAKMAEPGAVMGALTANASSERAKVSAGGAVSALARAAAPAAPAQVAEDPAVAFRRAAENGDLAALQGLLEKQSDINARDSLGRTALMLATLHGQTNAAAALLAYGADPNAADAGGTTPFQAARAGNQAAIAATLQRYGGR